MEVPSLQGYPNTKRFIDKEINEHDSTTLDKLKDQLPIVFWLTLQDTDISTPTQVMIFWAESSNKPGVKASLAI